MTKVPPDDILQKEHVPPAPPVKNMTNGAVSDAEAQRWADASNRDSGWYKWAEANDQPGMLIHLVGPAVIAPNEEAALGAGGWVDLPDCDLYPTSNTLFPISASDQRYFAAKQLPTDNAYVFVVVYPGPCSEVVHDSNGQRTTFQAFAAPTTVFVPGRLRSDPVLGDIWFSDAGGGCDDQAGPPAEWCSR